MLAICDSRRTLGRRSFLRIGSLGLGGLSLANLLTAQQASISGKFGSWLACPRNYSGC